MPAHPDNSLLFAAGGRSKPQERVSRPARSAEANRGPRAESLNRKGRLAAHAGNQVELRSERADPGGYLSRCCRRMERGGGGIIGRDQYPPVEAAYGGSVAEPSGAVRAVKDRARAAPEMGDRRDVGHDSRGRDRQRRRRRERGVDHLDRLDRRPGPPACCRGPDEGGSSRSEIAALQLDGDCIGHSRGGPKHQTEPRGGRARPAGQAHTAAARQQPTSPSTRGGATSSSDASTGSSSSATSPPATPNAPPTGDPKSSSAPPSSCSDDLQDTA